jgi:hypothetical protein
VAGETPAGGNQDPPVVDHTAAQSLLGYLYQVEVALLELIRRSRGPSVDPALALSIERFDNVAFERAGSAEEILQTKHSLYAAKSLTDASVDLWRTIKVWIDLASEGAIEVERAALSLLTTSTASSGGAASLLRPDAERDVAHAGRILERIAGASTNQENAAAYTAFLTLPGDQRARLVAAVVVLDRAPTIRDVRSELLTLLWHATDRRFHEQLITRLPGWWYGRVVRHLTAPDRDPILADEVELEIGDLREQLVSDNLPSTFPGTGIGNSPQGPLETATVTANGLTPGTYTCKVVVDP